MQTESRPPHDLIAMPLPTSKGPPPIGGSPRASRSCTSLVERKGTNVYRLVTTSFRPIIPLSIPGRWVTISSSTTFSSGQFIPYHTTFSSVHWAGFPTLNHTMVVATVNPVSSWSLACHYFWLTQSGTAVTAQFGSLGPEQFDCCTCRQYLARHATSCNTRCLSCTEFDSNSVIALVSQFSMPLKQASRPLFFLVY